MGYYDYDDEPRRSIVYDRGCTCNIGFNWENGPCDYCNGEYDCQGGCGEQANECRCDEMCPQCGELDCEDEECVDEEEPTAVA